MRNPQKQPFRNLFPNAKPVNAWCHDCDWKCSNHTDIKAARAAANRHANATDHTVAFWESINLRPSPPVIQPSSNQLNLFGEEASQ